MMPHRRGGASPSPRLPPSPCAAVLAWLAPCQAGDGVTDPLLCVLRLYASASLPTVVSQRTRPRAGSGKLPPSVCPLDEHQDEEPTDLTQLLDRHRLEKVLESAGLFRSQVHRSRHPSPHQPGQAQTSRTSDVGRASQGPREYPDPPGPPGPPVSRPRWEGREYREGWGLGLGAERSTAPRVWRGRQANLLCRSSSKSSGSLTWGGSDEPTRSYSSWRICFGRFR